jgi:transcriptional regulator GlxA family with amidase domain
MPPTPSAVNPQTNPKSVDLRVRAVMQMLIQRRSSRIRIGHLAREVGISHCHLSRLFSQEMQMPPSRLLRQARFEKAREMLQDTNLSVKEVMTAVGINDKSHFARDFKRVYGIGPAEYRRWVGSRTVEPDIKSGQQISRNANP